MKAITVWQPWAQLLAEGKKHDETRSWRTNYRGEILIHAAKKPYSQTERLMTAESRKKIRDTLGLGFINWREKIPTGVIIGKAILRDCKLIEQVLCLRLCLQGTGHDRNQGRAASHCTGIGGKQ